MIPSLVASEIRSSLIEYLASTFALSDGEVREALSTFLEDQAEGIFRGPYLRVQTPLAHVESSWGSPLEWLPDGFVPYQHQAKAFERLSNTGQKSSQPTLVTTGTGSGTTECYLYPILDHCARTDAKVKPGIKALILCPMNALASDHAGRIAALIAGDGRLAGVTAGLYVGEDGRTTSMGPDHLIDERDTLRGRPPDILLTNYKMLDHLLLRQEDHELWAVNDPDTLQYVVLDGVHTYDDAQGTDVAMLLRRLGATLHMAGDDGPLGSATPVATSTTVGSGEQAIVELREFAGRVFGTAFGPGSVVGETRQTVEEACGEINFRLPIPDARAVADLTDQDAVVAAFCTDIEDGTPFDDVVVLGERLAAHPLTRAVLTAVGDRSRSLTDALTDIVVFAPEWGRSLMTGEADKVERALAQYIGLLSIARRRDGERLRPLFAVEIQLWIREVRRLLRTVSENPSFRWRDSAAVVNEHLDGAEPGTALPAIYCRRCGMSGWMALGSEVGDIFVMNPTTIHDATLSRSPMIRALMRSDPDDPRTRWFSPSRHTLVEHAGDGAVPVLMSGFEDDAMSGCCPGCNERHSIRFLGLTTASLASVSIDTLFASPGMAENEPKLLAFSDSAQEASHHAGFFGGRTHRINLRTLMARIIKRERSLSLRELGHLLMLEADTPRQRFGLIPPDLSGHPAVATTWTDGPAPGSLHLLAQRLHFEVDLEFGLRSRDGRTLELSRVAAASVLFDDGDPIVDLIAEEIERLTSQLPDPLAVPRYVRGLLERLRLRGGLVHPLLEPFVRSGGKKWYLWGGRPDGLPPFTPDQAYPRFYTTATRSDLDPISALVSPTATWLTDWGVRTLGLEASCSRELNLFTMKLLAEETDTVVATPVGPHTVYGLNRRSIQVVDVPDDGGVQPVISQVRCDKCGDLHAVDPARIGEWLGTTCLRFRCVGHYGPARSTGSRYYRSLYRSGITRRVVTGEHTGLLGRAEREDLEKAFADGTTADAPNVITAIPTLEMGIDIGDLSAVMLTSVPSGTASYIRRVGRAGRASGNALITTFVSADTHGLHYLADPRAILGGDVRPPNCHLDAVETLQRQYTAYLIDRIADQTIDAPAPPRQIGALMKTGLDDAGFLRAIIDASTLDAEHADRFLSAFGNRLAPSTANKIRAFARAGIETAIKAAHDVWQQQLADFDLRRARLTAGIDRIESEAELSADDRAAVGSLRGQLSTLQALLHKHRSEYWISALERLGILPNYTLIDDAATLTAAMWTRDADGHYRTETIDDQRPGRKAIREFAPGNSFYAGGHRHRIDALEIGSGHEPLYRMWRLCPDCGYAAIESKDEPPEVCPRCASQAIADIDARHKILRLRKAFATGPEERARVFDESDDQRRERYETVLAVDVEPAGIDRAWMLDGQTFGGEFAAITHLRTINLGFSDRPGETLPIAGHPQHVTRFTVCAHCGAVGAWRDDRTGAQPERLHQGWCNVGSGEVDEQWDPILLLHELTTEAVRLLLPISMFEVDERMASFKGAILLGLQGQVGGDPGHLEVAFADMPNPGGQGRRRFLVLFDTVPGGTGYLARLAEPERMRSILEAARAKMACCVCITEGRQACHRCLLGVVDRDEYGLARRDLALQMLDELLGSWETHPVDSVGNADIGNVEESELTRGFATALRDWANATPNENITWQRVPGNGGHGAFELSLEHNGLRSRYRIDEQEGLSATPSSSPDYLIRRMGGHGPAIAVYLDGSRFRESDENPDIACEAQKRRKAGAGGRLVWNLVWDDVTAFHDAVTNDPPTSPPLSSLLEGRALSVARAIQHDKGGLFDIDALNQNPMALLLDYLARPDANQWRRAALSAVGGVAASGRRRRRVGSGGVIALLEKWIAGVEPDADSTDDAPVAFASRVITGNDLPLLLVLDTRNGRADDERWTIVASLDDSFHGDENLRRLRWQDWLHWSNILQFTRGPQCRVIISATSEHGSFAVEELCLGDLWGGIRPSPDQPFTLSDESEQDLDLVQDDRVRTRRTGLRRRLQKDRRTVREDRRKSGGDRRRSGGDR